MCHHTKIRAHASVHASVCAAPGTVCRNPTHSLSSSVISRHCRYHACRRVVSGRACPMAKYPGEALCREHMRCTAVENGMSCAMNVKDVASERFHFCAEFHLCTFPSCENQRLRRNGEDLQFCNDHRCDHDGCRNAKDAAGPYCRLHTCEGTHCTSFVSGDTERFCERHRRCARPSCSRFCHLRENDVASPYCGAHYCEFTDCENERDAGAHCVEHTCEEPGCARGVDAAKAMYCKEHECKTRGCRMKRLGREYCPYHDGILAMDGVDGSALWAVVTKMVTTITTKTSAAGKQNVTALCMRACGCASAMGASSGGVKTSGWRRLSTAAATNAWSQSATDSEGRLQWPWVSAWRCYSVTDTVVDTRDAATE
ncbi:hypothetical protein B0T10DRAFT_563869 [Thelonectria olida]|uniref:Uncharacterized protein n=1 Tax=Thelonectria olida TaxID=1576542 RepID=A0A9P9AMZ1_9HYPO|nr:hypothetical protein B0T10DRAFT_563869 [Thelonectria olida]